MKEEDKIFIAKEIIDVRKKYLEQIEKFDSKVFFALLSGSLSLVISGLTFGNQTISLLGCGLFLFTIILEFILDFRRKKYFNKLIKEIKEGVLKEI